MKASEKLLMIIDSIPEFRHTKMGNIRVKMRERVFLSDIELSAKRLNNRAREYLEIQSHDKK